MPREDPTAASKLPVLSLAIAHQPPIGADVSVHILPPISIKYVLVIVTN